MLNIIIDGASFNAPKYVGENLVTTGGVHTSETIEGTYFLGAHLNDGFGSPCALIGEYDFGYNGGMGSNSTVWSEYWTLPAVLNDGVYSDIDIGSKYIIDFRLLDGMKSTIISNSSITFSNQGEGISDVSYANIQTPSPLTVVSSINLKGNETGPSARSGVDLDGMISDSSMYRGVLVRSSGLSGGMYSRCRVYGFLIAGVMITPTFISSSRIEGELIIQAKLRDNSFQYSASLSSKSPHFIISPTLQLGIDSTSTLSVPVNITAILSSGFAGADSCDGERVLSEILSSGFATSVTLGSLDITVAHILYENTGMNLSSIGGAINIQAIMQEGLNVVNQLSSLDLVISGILTGGLISTNILPLESVMFTSLKVTDGVSSNNTLASVFNISCVLSIGVNNTQRLEDLIKISPVLQDGFGVTTTHTALLIQDAMLSLGILQPVKYDAPIAISATLHSGIDNTPKLDGYVKLDAVLRGGTFSSTIIQGPLSVSFDDKYINNRAIYVRSATIQLTLITPKQDI